MSPFSIHCRGTVRKFPIYLGDRHPAVCSAVRHWRVRSVVKTLSTTYTPRLDSTVAPPLRSARQRLFPAPLCKPQTDGRLLSRTLSTAALLKHANPSKPFFNDPSSQSLSSLDPTTYQPQPNRAAAPLLSSNQSARQPPPRALPPFVLPWIET
jgi:hypothetical protein